MHNLNIPNWLYDDELASSLVQQLKDLIGRECDVKILPDDSDEAFFKVCLPKWDKVILFAGTASYDNSEHSILEAVAHILYYLSQEDNRQIFEIELSFT
ncbi:TPA: hypothetical protein DD449_04530 [Candidatus Berkelbacteria bacterium]|uniref:Uncharacterized protein n=1 Tax=Berkelbacteria bacterium GW2011_GWE1_39_12 TaxID=1618337 RepID=A0A0G4B306_9BACT|nr:MAG: hypothetical protein UT28_C0001G0526 [Berkelbacteria bacterium GW2011_GWE1_39_12]HBO60922.1 hypothetical protein [Candidatus Berkelbacteria bacterium]